MKRDFSYPLRVAADKWPDHVVFVYKERRWTFREFDAATDRLASAFARRGLTGRRVVLLMQNEPMTVMSYLALARAGAVSVPVNPRLLSDELMFILDDSEASAIIADSAFLDAARELTARSTTIERLLTVGCSDAEPEAERLEDLLLQDAGPSSVDVDPMSTAMLVYTSGTSGFPKGVSRTHDANLWTCVNTALGQTRFPDDIEIFVLPLFGIAFIFQVMPLVMSGGTIVLDGPFDPARTWELLEAHRATRVFLAPTMLDSMLAVDGHEQRDVSSLRVLNTAYEFPERVRNRASERFGDIIAYMYGLTEAQLCVSTPREFSGDPSNAGHPMGMMRVRVVDEERNPVDAGVIGEITMEGPSLMSGYHGREEATRDVLVDGWLYTGDLGYVDEHGRLHISGRKKEIIKSGGFTVDPVEVERALLAFPGVREAAVIGAPDEHWGEVVVAFVTATESVQESESELLAFVKSQVASFKCPKRVSFISELPKNPMGKIERAKLRARAAAALDPSETGA